jgi:hypothetical protein
MDGMELCLLLSRVVVDTKVVRMLMPEVQMDISKLPCPNGLWSHGTFNFLNVLEHQTPHRDECPTWLGILETSVICSPRGSCRSKVLPYNEDSIRESG